jgi:NodT family efflux transporter outer membrane factor (OMF) lipoprotein
MPARASLQKLAGAALLALAACAVGPDWKRPDAPRATRYTEGEASTTTVAAAGRAQTFREGQRIAADWWRLFGSAKLDAVVAETLGGNPGLAAARASLARSQHILRAGYGVFFPAVDASAGLSRQRSNPTAAGISFPATDYSLSTLSASVSYTLDIWGGERRAVEELGAAVDEQRYALVGTWLMLAGNAVNAVIARAAYLDQIEVTSELVAFEEKQLQITEAQVRAGAVPFANVLSLRSQLASTEALLPPLELRVEQAEHLLAALAGRLPSDRAAAPIALGDLALPRDVPVSLPSDLVRQRPDILLAEAELHAATADIGVATAALLPSLTLSGGYGVANNFSTSGAFWNLGAGLAAPIFHGDAQWNQRKAALDARDQAFALYRQAVLGAFQQVADTLRALTHDAEALLAEDAAVEAAEGALELTQFNYQAGIATYLQVLVVDGQYLQAKLGYIQAAAQRLQDTVALYVALGGGWWNAAKPIDRAR